MKLSIQEKTHILTSLELKRVKVSSLIGIMMEKENIDNARKDLIEIENLQRKINLS